MAKANAAWLNHRAGGADSVVRDGHAALDRWRSVAYPFEWLARWPLLAVMVSQGEAAGAAHHARAMLAPDQQLPPAALATALEMAVEAWDQGRLEAVQAHLAQALGLAAKMGHL